MPMPGSEVPTEQEVKQGVLQTARAWGENPLPATGTAALIFAQHARPFQTLPMLFPPVLLFSSYLNVSGYKKDSAGLTAAWSAAYLVLARRRKFPIMKKFGARGITRGGTIGLCIANIVGGGIAYAFGNLLKNGTGL